MEDTSGTHMHTSPTFIYNDSCSTFKLCSCGFWEATSVTWPQNINEISFISTHNEQTGHTQSVYNHKFWINKVTYWDRPSVNQALMITFPCHYNQSSGNFFTSTSPAYFVQAVSNSKGPLEWLPLSSQIQAVLAGGSCWSHSDRIIVWFETCQLSRLTVLGSWLTTQTTQ